jgi:hypothetical protein
MAFFIYLVRATGRNLRCLSTPSAHTRSSRHSYFLVIHRYSRLLTDSLSLYVLTRVCRCTLLADFCFIQCTTNPCSLHIFASTSLQHYISYHHLRSFRSRIPQRINLIIPTMHLIYYARRTTTITAMPPSQLLLIQFSHFHIAYSLSRHPHPESSLLPQRVDNNTNSPAERRVLHTPPLARSG